MKLSKCTLVTAAALTVASLSFVSTSSAEMGANDANNTSNRAGNAVNNTADRVDRAVDNARDSANTAVNGNSNANANTNANTNANVNTNTNAAMSADAAGIGSIIGQVTEAAVTKGAFDDLAERFTEADRNRLGKEGVVDKDQPELDALATKINDAWKAKYGHAFDIDSAKIYTAGFMSVEPGAMGRTNMNDNGMSNNGMNNNAATDGRKDLNTGANGSAVAGAAGGMNPADGNRNTASGRMDSTHVDPNGNTNTRTDSVPNTGAEVTTKSDGTMAGPAGKSGGVDMTAAADQQKATGAENKSATGARDNETVRTGIEGVNSNLPNNANNNTANNNTGAADGANTASGSRAVMVRIPASHGLPELQVPFVQEGALGGWRIDLADNIDGATLQRNLLAHLNAVQSMQAQWPADEADAYRAVSHHVLAALQNVPSVMASGAE